MLEFDSRIRAHTKDIEALKRLHPMSSFEEHFLTILRTLTEYPASASMRSQNLVRDISRAASQGFLPCLLLPSVDEALLSDWVCRGVVVPTNMQPRVNSLLLLVPGQDTHWVLHPAGAQEVLGRANLVGAQEYDLCIRSELATITPVEAAPHSFPSQFEVTWLLRNSASPGRPDTTTLFGGVGGIPVVGNWNGTGCDSIGVFTPAAAPGKEARWLLRGRGPGDPDISFGYGGYGDFPVVGNWNGTDRDSIGVFRPAAAPGKEARWLLRRRVGPGDPDISFGYGGYGDGPVVGNWNGTDRDSIGVFRPAAAPGKEARWLLRRRVGPGDPDISFGYGGYGDGPVVGNWNGTDRDSIGVFRPAAAPGKEARWLLRRRVGPGDPDISFGYGGYGDGPVVGNWNGTDRDSIGVFRPAAAPGKDDQWLLPRSVGRENSNISLS